MINIQHSILWLVFVYITLFNAIISCQWINDWLNCLFPLFLLVRYPMYAFVLRYFTPKTYEMMSSACWNNSSKSYLETSKLLTSPFEFNEWLTGTQTNQRYFKRRKVCCPFVHGYGSARSRDRQACLGMTRALFLRSLSSRATITIGPISWQVI